MCQERVWKVCLCYSLTEMGSVPCSVVMFHNVPWSQQIRVMCVDDLVHSLSLECARQGSVMVGIKHQGPYPFVVHVMVFECNTGVMTRRTALVHHADTLGAVSIPQGRQIA